MARYRFVRLTMIDYQEGDDSSFTITIPDVLDITNADAKIQICYPDGTVLFEKELGDGLEKAGQVLTITIDAEDTEGVNGGFTWELELNDPSSFKRVTSMQGAFNIIKTYIRNV